MNRFYKELPNLYTTYIKDGILNLILESSSSKYQFFKISQSVCLTKEGIEKFSFCDPMICIFKSPPNYVGSLHKDSAVGAFNFVLTKNGFMEWFDLDKLTQTHTWHDNNHYDSAEQLPIESTKLHTMYVATQIPHRIINDSAYERICLSIRSPIDISVIRL